MSNQFTDEDGLPGMTIYDLLQDSKGALWIGTNNGICRYEGTNFKTFNSPLLKGNEILQIDEHPDGKIYFHNLEGQMAYIENGQIHLYRPKGFIDSIGIFHFDFTSEALWLHHADLGTIIRYTLYPDGSVGNRFSLREENDNFLFHQGTVIRFNRLEQIKHLKLYSSSFPKDTSYTKLFNPYGRVDWDDLLFLSDKRKIITSRAGGIYTIKNDSIQQINAFSNAINQFHIFEDQIYVLSRNGFIILDDQASPLTSVIMEGISVNTVLPDREGNYWVGTTENGLYQIPSLDFKIYQSSNSSIPSNKVYCIHQSPQSNRLLIGQEKGYVTIIQDRKITQSIKSDTETRINAIVEDQYGYLYLGNDKFISILNPQLRTFNKWRFYAVKELAINLNNGLIVSGASLAYLVDDLPAQRKTKSGLVFRKRMTAYKTYAAIQTFDSTYWIGTTQGLYTTLLDSSDFQYDFITPQGGEVYHYHSQPFIHNGQQLYYSVNTILQAPDSMIWVATQNDGLIKIKNHQLISTYTTENGLVSNKVKKLFVDQQGMIWVGTDQGLQIMDPQLDTFNLIDKLDGLPSNDITAIHVGPQDVWLGTSSGLVNFPRKSIVKNKIAPNTQITNIGIWERDTTLHPHYDLNYDQNNLRISFEGIALRARGTNRYQYRMLGIDTNWIETDSRLVRYPALNPGNYRFEVIMINEDGVKSQQPATVSLSIHPPLWKRPSFIITTILLVFGLMVLFFYLRIRSIRQREQEKRLLNEQFNELKMQALQVQMNPHFVFNALNAIQKYLTTNEQEQAMVYLARFARLIRMIFEQSKKKEISLEEEIEFLKLYLDLEKLRFKEKVEIDFKIDANVEQKLALAQLPPLLIQPIIENAFKHGLLHKKGKGFLKIHFSKNQHYLICTVEDNGVGRTKSQEYSRWKSPDHHSSGLETTQQRLLMFNKKRESSLSENIPTITIDDLLDASGQPNGTRVKIFLSIN